MKKNKVNCKIGYLFSAHLLQPSCHICAEKSSHPRTGFVSSGALNGCKTRLNNGPNNSECGCFLSSLLLHLSGHVPLPGSLQQRNVTPAKRSTDYFGRELQTPRPG